MNKPIDLPVQTAGSHPQPVTSDVLMEKYAKGSEASATDIRRRVAKALAAAEEEPSRHEEAFFRAMEEGVVLAGRINSAAGTDLKATLINCFVQPVGDAVTAMDGEMPGIYTALAQAAETMRRGGGVGYDFSKIRPEGAMVKGTRSNASGPISYMKVFDRSCETVESAGSRRGAQMGILRCDHPDIEKFIRAKETGGLTNFNLSVAVLDAFMVAVKENAEWDLIHKAEPGRDQIAQGAFQREDGMWVYRTMRATDLFDLIMRSTYEFSEPGVVFIDRANRDNNLSYCEVLEATNPCAEQFLPAYGCCDLGQINLTALVEKPFHPDASFNLGKFTELVAATVRMLDNVLDVTEWPLLEQENEAQMKRRVGVGFLGLGSALAMLGLRYDSSEGRQFATMVAKAMRDSAYRASIKLAEERGAFPLFDANKYLAHPGFASRLPDDIKKGIRQHGIRNSHLLSIAPTGTIALAFADNASNGIEPPFALSYWRKKRNADGSWATYEVQDHAYRVYLQQGRDPETLPPSFVTALGISAADHCAMVKAVAGFIDASVSKTVNVAKDYPYDRFKSLYLEAWEGGLKGITTYRPNDVLGSVLSVEADKANPAPNDLINDLDRRVTITETPQPALASLRWPGRPSLPAGNMAWTYMVEHAKGNFAVFIGETTTEAGLWPFEVWVNGSEQPRGLGAVAKTLSMDMRSNDRGWLDMKLQALIKTIGDDGFDLAYPPRGDVRKVPSLVSGFGQLVRYRLTELDALESQGQSPMLDALISKKEPKAGPGGTMSWTVDVANPATGDDFVLGVKELVMPDGSRRPYSMWLSGVYPKVLDGLCKLLSIDMRIVDPQWIGEKLNKLTDYPEARGDFLAFTPGSPKQQSYPSTVAYIARLVLHRYFQLGVLDEDGKPVADMGIFEKSTTAASTSHSAVIVGRVCVECNAAAVIKKDGCDYCTACGALGSCG